MSYGVFQAGRKAVAHGMSTPSGASPVTQWSDTGGCGQDTVDPSRNDILVAYVEHLGGALKTLGEQVQAVEARQTLLDRRLVELGSLLQGLQEEQCAMICAQPQVGGGAAAFAAGAGGATDGGRRAVALNGAAVVGGDAGGGRTSALDGLGDLMLISARCNGGGNRQLSLTNGGSRGHPGTGVGREVAAAVAVRQNDLDARIQAIERDQKMVAVGVHRALQAALVTRQEQQWKSQEDDWYRCLEGLIKPAAELDQQWASRFNEQDQRMERIIHMVDSLADNVLQMSSGAPLGLPAAEGSLAGQLADSTNRALDSHGIAELRDKVEQIEANLVFVMASQTQHPAQAVLDRRDAVTDGGAQAGRLEHKMNQRLDDMQDDRDDIKAALRQLNRQVPEVTQRVDQLWTHCHYYFPRIKEQDVRLEMFRKTFENHKQHMLEAIEQIPPHDIAYLQRHAPLTPEESSLLAEGDEMVLGSPASEHLKRESHQRFVPHAAAGRGETEDGS